MKVKLKPDLRKWMVDYVDRIKDADQITTQPTFKVTPKVLGLSYHASMETKANKTHPLIYGGTK